MKFDFNPIKYDLNRIQFDYNSWIGLNMIVIELD